MTVAPGMRLGPYEVQSAIGAGGMGEVYKARDGRLNREVALKILPREFAEDAGRRGRFEREAKAAAALNHPNILGLYDVGEQDGVMYMITELVPGETLSATIARGPVPVKKLLDIAAQIADGMSCAHAAGIAHRDLKPANIMVTPEGRVKILDFGLARQTERSASDGWGETATRTHPGTILGTVNYMSPEQARGLPADHRSDQFSFGLILYEMVTGRKAFDKPEPLAGMLAIMNDEAPPIDRPIPTPLRWTIERCLEKEPAGRYESSRDLYQELCGLRAHLSEATTQHAVPLGRARNARTWFAVAALGVVLLVTFVGGGLILSSPVYPDQSNYRFTPFAFDPQGQGRPIWSPDGKAVAYSARGDTGSNQVFVRRLDSEVPVQVTHITEAALPVGWTADSHRIFFWSTHQPRGVWSVATVGGDPESAVADVDIRVTISPDGKALAAFKEDKDGVGTVWISAPLGAPLKRYEPDPFAAGEYYNVPTFRFSPDGRNILLLIDVGVRADRLAWLLPYPPDPGRPPKRVLPALRNHLFNPSFCWLLDGRRILYAAPPGLVGSEELWIADVDSGDIRMALSRTGDVDQPTLSPDGTHIVFTETVTNSDVVSARLDGSAPQVLVATDRNEMEPAWAAKQPVLAYVTDRNGQPEIWVRSGNVDRPLVTARDFAPGTTGRLNGPALSPEGDRVIYTRFGAGSDSSMRLWISALSGGAPVPLTNDASVEYAGSWSPDGKWFVYQRVKKERGGVELVKVKTGGQSEPVVIKTVGLGMEIPSWSPTGDWIAYGSELISADGQSARPLGNHRSPHYVFSPDGKLVYGIRAEGERTILFSVDIASGAEKVIGDLGTELRPARSPLTGVRFSLAPDGKSFAYSTTKRKSNLWLLEGFAAETGLLARLGLR